MSIPPDDPNDASALTDYDLHAWHAPPPPAGLTDSVLARMQVPLPAQASARTRSARTISAVAGATLVAAVAVAALMMTHNEPPPQVVASQTQPQVTPLTQPAVQRPLPAGSPADDARVQALEKRVLELEVTVEELRTSLARVRQPPAPPPPPPSPRPRPLDLPRDDDSICDPFMTPHGCSPPVAVPRPIPPDSFRACDDEQLVLAGEVATNNGNYAAALSAYESALGCNDTMQTRKLAYTSACLVRDVAKARAYFASLDDVSRRPLAQVCLRNGIDPATQPLPADTATGTVRVSSVPQATIWIDNVSTKQQTPVTLTLPAGKHKITLAIGGDKYTYPLRVIAGETVVFSKALQ